MGHALSSLLGWVWRKFRRTPSPCDPHPHGRGIDINAYAHDPELGVESPEEAEDVGEHYESAMSCDDEQTGLAQLPGHAGENKKRWLGPYNSSHKILLVGEGDFSFSASLGSAFGDASNMTATSLDSVEFLGENYSRALRNIIELTRRGCRVLHGIDATRMANDPSLKSLKFDRIIFNFPHAGFFNHDEPRPRQISRHQALVKGFLANAKKLIREDGEIHITQKTTSFFRQWNIKSLASSEGLRLVGETPFNFHQYRGYRTKFGYGGDVNVICSSPCTTYIFQLE